MEKLLSSGGAYPCFCLPEELERERAAAQAAGKAYRYSGKCRSLSPADSGNRMRSGLPFSVRLRVEEGKTAFHDLIRGEVAVDHSEIDDFILARSGGEPTYNFTAAVDDALMRISHVIRGEDHISNTPKQMLLYRALGFDIPLFAHIPLIMGADRQRLSKRHGASAVGEFRRQGYLPEAMMNYLALLGWSLDDKTDVLSREELVRSFSLERVVKSAACFDYGKLQWFNGHYLRVADPERVYQLCAKQLLEEHALSEDFLRTGEASLRRMILAVRGNLRTVSEVGEQLTYFLGEVHSYDPKGMEKYGVPATVPLLERAIGILTEAEGEGPVELEKKFRALADQEGKKLGDYVHPLRLAVTGRTSSPGIFELVDILGKGRCVVRLKRFIRAVRSQAAPAGPSSQ